jgi:hypothetical protein
MNQFLPIDQGPTHKKSVLLQDGLAVVKTESLDGDTVANTTAHRRNESVKTGDKFGIHDQAPIIYHFQAEQSSWNLFKKKRRDLYRALQSTDQVVREKAAATIARLHPEWVVASPNAKYIMG